MKLSMPHIRDIVAQELTEEAERYRVLACEAALKLVLNPAAIGDKAVHEHLVRAETLKAAAAIVAGNANWPATGKDGVL